VALLIAIVLALTVLPTPWNLAFVAAAAVWEVVTMLGAMWWSQRRAAKVGTEALIGREVGVRNACRPVGRVSVKGELWQASCAEGASAGEVVRIVGIDGLTLVVEAIRPR
jgi:membrane protein implicated in regulation of membrane protease activity